MACLSTAVVTGGVIAQCALGDQRMLAWSDLPMGGSLWGVSYRPLMFVMIRSRVFLSRVGNFTTLSSCLSCRLVIFAWFKLPQMMSPQFVELSTRHLIWFAEMYCQKDKSPNVSASSSLAFICNSASLGVNRCDQCLQLSHPIRNQRHRYI